MAFGMSPFPLQFGARGGGGGVADPILAASPSAYLWVELGHIYQDRAGLVAVTAAGQPVGRITCKAGTSTVAVAADDASRGTYQVDGNGVGYIDSDGSGERYNVNIPLPSTMTQFAAVIFDKGTTNLVSTENLGAPTDRFAFYLSASNGMTFRTRTGSTTSEVSRALGLDTKAIVWASGAAPEVTVGVDFDTSTGAVVAWDTTNIRLMHDETGSRVFDGKFYGWVLYPSILTADQRSAILQGLSALVAHDIVAPAQVMMSFGYGSDLHFGDKDTAINRYYRDGDKKLADAVIAWNAANVSFVIFNGDFIDHGTLSEAQALSDLATIEAVFADLTPPRYYSFGNHCLDKISKTQFIANTAMTAKYYSFDTSGIHFVVLDSCYTDDDDDTDYDSGAFTTTDIWIPPTQRAWLSDDLAGTSLPVIVFCHHRLSSTGSHFVNNSSVVRGILEGSGKVIGVFTGHSHSNNKTVVEGVTYYNMYAMTENAYPENGYAVVSVYDNNSISVAGTGGQTSYAPA